MEIINRFPNKISEHMFKVHKACFMEMCRQGKCNDAAQTYNEIFTKDEMKYLTKKAWENGIDYG